MLNILVLCSGNSCRSILGEALFNHLGKGRIKAYSAGSHPKGKVNPNALATLKRHRIQTGEFSSRSWEEFDGKGIDIAITVCDQAAGEVCPVYLNSTVRGHWSLPDPAHVTGSQDVTEAAFESIYAALEKRINQLLALPIETMSRAELAEALDKIGTGTRWGRGAA
ncbi:Protein tyrosine phosphatase [Candidatus Methylobacter favarea]|uniref:Protein tyrosine phosphatase n=1 Tax=Candidatus Methylobacter favarea TaxID=2707345 RepID=A0A8S0XIQ9_9GAMM|nr:arsenate reductase ArsC [Candidatus Methylobacter favarea]CAA9891006.1 Protein tyrosine phosphatase [Candidatus Methylobacter favarea]